MEKLIASSKLALGAVVLGLAAGASAEPTFSVNTGLFAGSGPVNDFQSDFISGVGSTLLTITSPTTISGAGYIRFNNWQIPGGTDTDQYGITGNSSNNTAGNYLLWAEYSYTTTLVGGAIGQAGSDYVLTSMTLQLWGEAANGTANNAVFNQANANTGTGGTVTHRSGAADDAVLLGETTSLITGVAQLNAAGGSSFTPTLLFALTDEGKQFFYAPDPFYNIAFGSFTNVATGVHANGNYIAINSANGGVTFDRALPEPASVALIGIAMLGAGVAARRRKAA